MEQEILRTLEEKGWNLQKAPNGLYHTRYQGENTELIVHLNIMNLENNILLVIAYLPISVKPEQIDKVAKLLNELNLKTYFGSFEMNYDIGEIAFRTGIFYFNTDFQMSMVINCLNAAVYYADVDYPLILKAVDNSLI